MSTSRLARRAAALSVLTFGGLASTIVAAPSALADPPGNNGTVKIAAEADIDEIPDNEPHQGCSFTVQWYNFDKGDDIISTVTFELQAPTNEPEHSLSVNGPGEVFVGDDEADGAGNDFDGEQLYTLDFTGTPAAQGYHVKLTVNTPGSLGADKKSKVFWVEGCETPEEPTPTPEEPTPTPEEPTPTPEETETPVETPTETPTVLGTETKSPAPVPTLVNAGVDGSQPGDGSNALGLLVLAGGGALGAASLVLARGERGRRQI